MKSRMIASLGAGFLLAFSLLPATAKADLISNQATQVTFQQSVRIPGRILPPGTYWLTVPNISPASELDHVEISNADRTHVIAQVMTEVTDPAQFGQRDVRSQGVQWPTGKVVLTFAQGANGQPWTLLDWYYPGRTDGHRFVYSTNREEQLTEENHETVSFRPGDTITIGRSLASFE